MNINENNLLILIINFSFFSSQLHVQQSVPDEPGHWLQGRHLDTGKLLLRLPSGWTRSAICEQLDGAECGLWSLSLDPGSLQRSRSFHSTARQLLSE